MIFLHLDLEFGLALFITFYYFEIIDSFYKSFIFDKIIFLFVSYNQSEKLSEDSITIAP